MNRFVVCFGDCKTAKFFTGLSDLATKYKLNHPIQLRKSGFLLGCGNRHVLGLHV
jgi:hypothetical protein